MHFEEEDHLMQLYESLVNKFQFVRISTNLNVAEVNYVYIILNLYEKIFFLNLTE